MRKTSAPVWVLAACLACGNPEALGMSALDVVSAGVVNDPANKSLRFDLLKFGLDRFCTEMRLRGAPLALGDQEPVMGRFFADGCESQIIDQPERQGIVVRYSGTGYGYTNLTERLGFASSGLVEYATDFQRYEDAMYIYFRPRSVGGTAFRTLLVESALAAVGMGVSGVDPDAIGRDIVARQLQRGFTVIRRSARGEVEFSMGLLPLGQRPFKPFQIVSSERATLDNDSTEVHVGQQDYVGGLIVPEEGRRLFLHLSLDGAPVVDIFLLSELDGRALTRAYVTQRGGAALTRAPLLGAELRAGQPLDLRFDVPKGNYYLMFDHSPSAGRNNPAPGEPSAKVEYLVQLGDR